jgi:hypothetical protein
VDDVNRRDYEYELVEDCIRFIQHIGANKLIELPIGYLYLDEYIYEIYDTTWKIVDNCGGIFEPEYIAYAVSKLKIDGRKLIDGRTREAKNLYKIFSDCSRLYHFGLFYAQNQRYDNGSNKEGVDKALENIGVSRD